MQRSDGEYVCGSNDRGGALRKRHQLPERSRSTAECVPRVANETIVCHESHRRRALQECCPPFTDVADQVSFYGDAADERDLAVTELEQVVHQPIEAELVVDADDRHAWHEDRALP